MPLSTLSWCRRMENYDADGDHINQAFVDAVKVADPTWEPGKAIPSGALDGITRESIESSLVKSGGKLVKRSSVSGSSLDIQV